MTCFNPLDTGQCPDPILCSTDYDRMQEKLSRGSRRLETRLSEVQKTCTKYAIKSGRQALRGTLRLPDYLQSVYALAMRVYEIVTEV